MERLRQRDNFYYCGRLIVESLRQHQDRYTLRIRAVEDTAAFEYHAKTIMLGCGAIGSAKLVLDALGMSTGRPFQTCQPRGTR